MSRSLFACCCALLFPLTVRADFVTFEGLPFGPGETSWHGPDPSGVEVNGPFGKEIYGSFDSGGVEFTNRYVTSYGSWSGFAYSKATDTTTPGYLNQYSAFPGAGHNGSGNYGVAFGYDDLEPNLFDPDPFDPTSLADLLNLPHFALAAGTSLVGAYLTNTTYAALSMQSGDSFAKKFGGASGNDPDWFKVSAYGSNAQGQVLAASVDMYLADFRSADNSQDFILSDWKFFDLSALAGASTIYFNVSSSDAGDFGLNTPGYFAIDDIQLSSPAPVPEPNGLVLAMTGAMAIAGGFRFRSRHGSATRSR